MHCPQCNRNIPEDSAFCIHCATAVGTAPEPQRVEAPAPGPTIRLDPAQAPSALLPAQHRPARPARPTRPLGHRKHRGRRKVDASVAIFFIGALLLLIARVPFWPAILVLIGLAHYGQASSRGRGNHALAQLIFFGGLALLFWTHTFWPGILILLIGSHVVRHRKRSWSP